LLQKNCEICKTSPTHMPTVHQCHRQTDGRMDDLQ